MFLLSLFFFTVRLVLINKVLTVLNQLDIVIISLSQMPKLFTREQKDAVVRRAQAVKAYVGKEPSHKQLAEWYRETHHGTMSQSTISLILKTHTPTTDQPPPPDIQTSLPQPSAPLAPAPSSQSKEGAEGTSANQSGR